MKFKIVYVYTVEIETRQENLYYRNNRIYFNLPKIKSDSEIVDYISLYKIMLNNLKYKFILRNFDMSQNFRYIIWIFFRLKLIVC